MAAFVLLQDTTTDFSDLLQLSREELDGLTQIESEFRDSAPIKIQYDNITVHEFHTDMRADPRPVFNRVLDFANEEINRAISAIETDSIKYWLDNWTIKNRFMTAEICLHCYTEHNQGDFVFEDTETHRVVVSIVAHFDAKYIYQSMEQNGDVFGIFNRFYSQLSQALVKL